MVRYRRHIRDVFFYLQNNMEKHKKFAKSIRVFIRNQKAQIRRQFLDVKKQEELIKEMYNKLNIVKVVK